MTIIRDAYDWNNVVFDANYLTGGIADRSPYKAAATVTAPVNWAQTRSGYAVTYGDSGLLSYADNAANRLAGSDATWIVLGKFERHQLNKRLICKRAAGIVSYDIYTHNSEANALAFYNVNTRKFSGASIVGRRLIAITLVNGNAPICYLDGTYASAADGTITIPSSVAAVSLGNYYNLLGNSGLNQPIQRVVILNRALLPAEISQLYQELMSERYPLRAYSFGCRISAPKDPPGVAALLKTDFTTRLADGRLADLSGNGYHGTVKPGFVAGPGMCGNSLVATSASRTYVDFGEVPINGVSKLTIVHYGQRGASNPAELIFDKGTAAGNRNDISQSTTNITWNVGNGHFAAITDANVNTSLFQSWSYNGDAAVNGDKCKVNLDGAKPTVTITANFPTTLPSTAGTPFTFGRLGWLANFPPPKQSDFLGVYLGSLTHEQTEYIRKQIARRSTFQLDMQRVPVSLANLVGPCEAPNTPFRLQAGGTWKVSEDAAGKRWFESVAGNNTSVYTPSTQAYGTWVGTVKPTTTGEYFWFISNTTNIVDANRNAYAVFFSDTTVRLYKWAPSGAFTLLATFSNAIVAGGTYDIAVTRTSGGKFTVYMKGTGYSDWTLLTPSVGTNPVTNNDYKASSYFAFVCATAAAPCKFSQPRFFAGPMTLDQLREHCS